jgi:hypothetical protein
MKVLTLTQPWATLVAIGAKRIETRSWQTGYRGPLAIHAAKGPGALGWMQMQHMCRHVEPFKSILDLNDQHPANVLPFGAIVATCELVDCVPTTYVRQIKIVHIHGLEWLWTEQEKAFGDYTPGRFAWLLANVKMLPEPIPAKGALGLWEWSND